MERITDQVLDAEILKRETENPACGALVVFEGVVRNHHRGRQVQRMEYTAYKPLAERVLQELEEEAKRRFGVAECRIVHRIGELAIGEASVVIVVRSMHRADAFDAAEWAIDTLKQRVPIWKNDFYADGTRAYQDGVPLSACSSIEHDSGSPGRDHSQSGHHDDLLRNQD
jgi:molybdopterin synthase catalytic subunit